MAKRKKKLSPIRQEYNRQYKLFQQRLKSAQKQGWDISGFQAPKYQESDSHLGKRIEELKELKGAYLRHFLTPPTSYQGRFKTTKLRNIIGTDEWYKNIRKNFTQSEPSYDGWRPLKLFDDREPISSDWITVEILQTFNSDYINHQYDEARLIKQIKYYQDEYGEIIAGEERTAWEDLKTGNISRFGEYQDITPEQVEFYIERYSKLHESQPDTEDIEEVKEYEPEEDEDYQDVDYDYYGDYEDEDYDTDEFDSYGRSKVSNNDISVFNIFDLIESKIDTIKDSHEYRTRTQYRHHRSGVVVNTAAFRENLKTTLHNRMEEAERNGTLGALSDYLTENYEALQDAFEAIDHYLSDGGTAEAAFVKALEILKGGNLTDTERANIEDYANGFDYEEEY